MSLDNGNKSFAINEWRVDPPLNRLSRADEIIKIDPQNMKVLELLASKPGEVFSQSEIEQQAWPGVIVTPNSVYQAIAQLRKAFGDDRTQPKYIETIARKGYRLVARVERTAEPVHAESRAVIRPKPKRLGSSGLTRAALAVIAVSLGVALLLDRRSQSASIPRLAGDTAEALQYGGAKESMVLRSKRFLRMGEAALLAGHFREATKLFDQAFETVCAFTTPTDPLRADYLVEAADAYLLNDELKKAAELTREALRILEANAPAKYPAKIQAQRILGHTLLDEERYSEAEAAFLDSLALSRELYGDLSMDALDARDSLVVLHVTQQNWEIAESMSREILADHVQVRGPGEMFTGFYRTRLAKILYFRGRQDAALEEANKALEILSAVAPPDHPYVVSARQALADILVQIGQYSEAESAARAVLEHLKTKGAEPWRHARASSTLGESLIRQGHLSQGEQHLLYAAHILRGAKGYIEKDAWRENERRLALLTDLRADAGSFQHLDRPVH